LISKDQGADDIRRQMAQIRKDMHDDVRSVIRSAEAMTNWQKMIAARPWVALGAAFAAGYLIVPRRKEPAPAPIIVADTWRGRQALKTEPRPEPRPAAKGAFGMVLGLIAPVAIRAAQGYAASALEHWLGQAQPPVGMRGPGPRERGDAPTKPRPAQGPWNNP